MKINKIMLRIPQIWNFKQCEELFNAVTQHIFKAETEISNITSNLTEKNFLSFDISKLKVYGKDKFLSDYVSKRQYDELMVKVRSLEEKVAALEKAESAS